MLYLGIQSQHITNSTEYVWWQYPYLLILGLLDLLRVSSPQSISHSQNWDEAGRHLWKSSCPIPAQVGPPTAGCAGSYPDEFLVSPKRETPHPLCLTHNSADDPHGEKEFPNVRMDTPALSLNILPDTSWIGGCKSPQWTKQLQDNSGVIFYRQTDVQSTGKSWKNLALFHTKTNVHLAVQIERASA